MNKEISIKAKSLIYIAQAIVIIMLLYSFNLMTNNIYAHTCSTSCAGSCTLHSLPCGESLAGCGYGNPTPPAGKAWCCPPKVTCTCTPGSCGGCTPSCPSGQSTTVSGTLCRQALSSCTGVDGCNDSCTLTGSAYCYTPETNVKPATPASITMTVDGNDVTLSTDPANPTIIHLPCAATDGTYNVTLSLPSFSPPATSRGVGYYFQADNYGDGTWEGWEGCDGATGVDFCADSTSRTVDFEPSGHTIPYVLKEGYEGKISGQYYTINACDNDMKYSLARVGYYIVETHDPLPTMPSQLKLDIDNVEYLLSTNSASETIVKIPYSGTAGTVTMEIPTISLPSGSKTRGYYFRGYNDGLADEWAASTDCIGVAGEDFCYGNSTNIQNFLPSTKTIKQVLKESADGRISGRYYTTNRCGEDIEYTNQYTTYYEVNTTPTCDDCTTNILPDLNTDMTAKQCTSTTYTGKDIHNPLHFNIDVTDANGLDDIQGLIVWFSKDTTVPPLVTISGSTPRMDVANDIGVFIRKNGATWDSPLMYGYDSTSGYWEATADGNILNNTNEVSIKIENIGVTTNGSTATFDFRLEIFPVTTNPSGLYNLYIKGIDSFMINNNVVEQSLLTRYFNWGFDLTDPVAGDITQQVQDATNTNITWSVSDSISGVARTVINGYRVGGTEFDLAKFYLPSAYTINKGDVVLNPIPASADIGIYNDSNAWIFINNPGETDLLSIGANERGEIDIYTTTYDVACNTNGVSEEVDLNPWFATRGGTVYSENNISSNAKDVSSVATLNGVFNVNTLMDKSLIDLGTELLATRNTTISTLIHSTFGAVRGALLYDSNNTKNYWFDLLMTKFSHRMAGFATFQDITTSVSNDCPIGTICYHYSEEEDLNIPSGYICDKPTLFVSEKSINIEPNITSDPSSLSGCIFLAGDNINILDGEYQSTGSNIEYDYLEGFMIAEDQITFPLVDVSKSLRDGIEVFGGAVALGSSPVAGESAISIKRDLRLFSQINPAVVLTYDNKYSSIATIFFGAEAPVFRQEIGFKSF